MPNLLRTTFVHVVWSFNKFWISTFSNSKMHKPIVVVQTCDFDRQPPGYFMRYISKHKISRKTCFTLNCGRVWLFSCIVQSKCIKKKKNEIQVWEQSSPTCIIVYTRFTSFSLSVYNEWTYMLCGTIPYTNTCNEFPSYMYHLFNLSFISNNTINYNRSVPCMLSIWA